MHGHGVRAESAAVNHEVTDIPLDGLTRAAWMSVVFVACVMVLMWGAWGFFLNQAKQLDPGKPAMAAEDYGQRLPATPRLQSAPTDDLTAYRAEQTAKLNGLAWVDQSAGTVRMPINAAMQVDRRPRRRLRRSARQGARGCTRGRSPAPPTWIRRPPARPRRPSHRRTANTRQPRPARRRRRPPRRRPRRTSAPQH